MVRDSGGGTMWSATLTSGDNSFIVNRWWESFTSTATPAVFTQDPTTFVVGGVGSSQVAIFVGESSESSVVIATSGHSHATYGFQLDTLKQLWVNRTLGDGYLGMPVQAGSLLIVKSQDSQAMAFDPLTGVAKWGRNCPDTLGGHRIYERNGFDASNPKEIVISCAYYVDDAHLPTERFGIVTATGLLTDLGPA